MQRDGTLHYQVGNKPMEGSYRQYSMVLTKFMFVDHQYMFMYFCLLPGKLRHYVTQHRNCEDIAMNWMVSGLTGIVQLADALS